MVLKKKKGLNLTVFHPIKALMTLFNSLNHWHIGFKNYRESRENIHRLSCSAVVVGSGSSEITD